MCWESEVHSIYCIMPTIWKKKCKYVIKSEIQVLFSNFVCKYLNCYLAIDK